jgi:hypothetical protein
MSLIVIFAGGGLVVGLVIGRWWALLLAVGVGIGIGGWEEADIPGWSYGFLASLFVAAGVALGVFLRRGLPRRA